MDVKSNSALTLLLSMWGQSGVARKAGVSRGAVRNWIKEGRVLDAVAAKRLVTASNGAVTLERLLYGDILNGELVR